jgi:ABC-type Mn2+/Zn2+ transport system permease subunit
MNTLRYLGDPVLAGLYWPGVVTALAIAAMCSLLSVLVVLKRLAFIGQGISHAALGGIGVASALGLVVGGGLVPRLLGIGLSQPVSQVLAFVVVFVFCLGSAVLIAIVSARGRSEPDTAIGIVLVGAMALGAILLHRAPGGVSWESFLFGSITAVTWTDAAIGWGCAVGVVGAMFLTRRKLVFWAFDPPVAQAMGVRECTISMLLLTLLTLATVTAMKLAGVVLATAMLVLPGAVALQLSARSSVVLVGALAAGVCGAWGGIVVSFELDWPTGPSIVCVLTSLYVLARVTCGAYRPRAREGR